MKRGVWGVAGLVLAVVACNDLRDAAVERGAERARACRGLTGAVQERVQACLDDAPLVNLSSGAKAEIDDIASEGAVLVIADRLSIGARQVSLDQVPGARDAVISTDEAQLSKLLREQKVRGLVVHRDLALALDRDRTVLARLANHDFLEWFQLRYVTDELLVYTVRSTPARISRETGKMLVDGLRARLEHRTPAVQSWKPSTVRLLAQIRLQGHSLVLRHAVGTDLEKVLDELAEKMRRRWEREVETQGIGRLDHRLADARIEVHVILERAAVEPRSVASLSDLWELGVDGMMFRDREGAKDDRFSYMPGSEAVAHAFNQADEFLQYSVKQHGWREKRPWEIESTRLDVIRGPEFMEARPGGGEVVAMLRGMPIVDEEEVTDEMIRQMLVDGGEWWLRNQRADGSFNYKYWPEQNRLSDDYNEVRHILGARDLVDTYRYRTDERYLAGARRSMDWLMQYAVDAEMPAPGLPAPPPDTLLFRYPLRPTVNRKPPNQKLGTVAVALLGWVQWAKVTGSHAEDENIRKMARFVVSMREASGRFEPYFVRMGHPYYGQKNDIVPGEAALALGMVAEYFGEHEWIEFFPSFLDYYEPWFRTRAANKAAAGRWPQTTYDNQTRLDLVQFGPWAVMASKKYYDLTGDDRAAIFGLEIADWMIDNYQWNSTRAPWPDYVGGYFKIPEELPAMQTFCYSEGTAAAYGIALRYKPEARGRYDTATRESIQFMRRMQYDDVDSYYSARADLIHGGVKYALNEGKVRTDYVGHALSTLSQYLDTRAADATSGLSLTPMVVDGTVTASALPPAGLPQPDRDAEDDDE